MQSDSTRKREYGIDLYLMAGLATTPHFMEKLRVALHGWLEQWWRPVHSELLFPYGDRSRRAFPQLWEIRSDMRRGFRRLYKSVGGNRAIEALEIRRVRLDRDRKTTLFIGHSGGGVAAVHAAQLLSERQGDSDCLIVMIGSPRCRIPEGLRQSVLSISAAGKDFVPRLGSFGGWKAGMLRIPSWHSDKHAPGEMRSVPIIGGHADYFRDNAPYVNPMGQSNLDITLEAIESWLIRWK
jgi:pimeloyl-ACP methyl ester carboxylesterase